MSGSARDPFSLVLILHNLGFGRYWFRSANTGRLVSHLYVHIQSLRCMALLTDNF